MIDHNKVVEALRRIPDPGSQSDIISGKRVTDLKVEGENVFFSLHTGGLDDKQKGQLNFKCQEEILSDYPEANVHIHMKAGGAGQGTRSVLPQVKNIIAVASGKGGVGKSTVSANLALGLAKLGYKTGLIDADLYGPSMPTMLGLKGVKPKIYEHYGKPVIEPVEKFGISIMSIGFVIEPEQAVVLRGPRLSGVLKQFIGDVRWPELDFMIVDLPPGTGDIHLSLVQSVPITGAVMVTTPQKVAIDDAIKAGNMFRIENINVPILGVVENMSWFTPAELPDNKYYLFGKGGGKKLAQAFNTVLLGQLPLIQSIQESGDTGKPAVMNEDEIADLYLEVTRKLVRQTILRNEMLDPTRQVDVQ
nr:Mrp/NBP35 family ATP-binding protein [Saprospiraceae bacterium]